MKIIAVADIHGSQYRVNLLLENIKKYKPDLAIICGDITQYGPGEIAKVFLDQIPIETLAVTGNIDSADVEEGIDQSKATRIEMKKIIKNGVPFIGTSGLNPDDFEKMDKDKLIDKNTVLVTHVPAYDTKDKIFIGMHGGSKELRTLIEKYKPRLVLSGHVHEDPGYMKLNETLIVNCSMAKRGEGALIQINNKISVKMLE